MSSVLGTSLSGDVMIELREDLSGEPGIEMSVFAKDVFLVHHGLRSDDFDNGQKTFVDDYYCLDGTCLTTMIETGTPREVLLVKAEALAETFEQMVVSWVGGYSARALAYRLTWVS